MVTTGMISREESLEAAAAPVDLRAQGRSLRVDSYFLDAVMKTLEETYSPEVVYHGGLRVYTTLDVQMQQQAEAALQQGIARMDMSTGAKEPLAEDDNGLQGALVAVEVNTGAVKALVGGRDFFKPHITVR
jgi:membrane peptidoglycan carboxypeptidase